MLRRESLGLLLILLAFLAFRLPPMLRQPGRVDEECYAVPGLTILRTGLPQLPHFPSRNPHSMFFHADEVLYAEPPLYFYLQAGLYAVLPPSYATARLLSAIASVLILWRVYELTRRWSGSNSAGLWAAGLLGLSRWFHYAAMIARPDIVCTLFGVLAIEAVDRWSEKPTSARLALCGLWLGLGGLTHPLAIVFAAQCAIWVLWRERGWKRFTQPAFLTLITLAVFALWLPLIMLHPELFWIQFDNQFVGHQNSAGQLTLWWLSRPLISLWYHADYLWQNIGAPQMLLALVPLIVGSVFSLGGKSPMTAKIVLLCWSSFLLLSLLVGTHHDVPSYWAYPGALLFICVGTQVAATGAWLRSTGKPFGTLAAVAGSLLLVAVMLPGSGARLFVEYVRHWNDENYNGRAFAQQLLAKVPADARCAVAGEFVLDFLAAGRNVLGIPSQPIYFDIQSQSLDWLVISRDSPKDLADKLCGTREAHLGRQDEIFACWAELQRVPPGPCSPEEVTGEE